MEKTLKSLNLVAATLLIINLGFELYDRFKPQMKKEKQPLALLKGINSAIMVR